MNISKISRRIVVVLFVALILFLSVLDVKYINSSNATSSISNIGKLGYVVFVVILVSMYTYVKEKLARLKLKKRIATLYRYTYIVLVMLGVTFFRVYRVMNEYSTGSLILYFALTYLIGFLAQRIIFNISKSDVLSVLSMFICYTLPSASTNITLDLNAKIISTVVLLSIYVMQTLIDELKQLNIKNRKYIKEAMILGVCIGLSTILGVSYIVWIIVGVVSLFVTSNLDTTNLNITKNGTNNVVHKRRNNYFIYKIEQIKISKLLISLAIVSAIVLLMYFPGRAIITKIATDNYVCKNIVYNLRIGFHSQPVLDYTSAKYVGYSFVSTSTKFYMLSFIYILIMELLSIILRRKYDTKTTLIKTIFISMYVIMTIYKLNVLYYQQVMAALLVLICIVDTTNIYYNREERIKMIEA